jgi:nitroreductase
VDAILARRSIRRYTPEPVSADDERALLEAAMAAPSAGNEQPWQFVTIRERATLDAITDFHEYAQMLKAAPLAILVCGDPGLEGRRAYWEQDCSAAVENMLIMAQSRGLGAVWLGVHPELDREEACRELLGIPEELVPFAIVSVGHPGETKRPAERYDDARVHRERW